MIKFHVLDGNMPADWFDFLGERVPLEESELLIVTDDFLDNYPKSHPNKIALLIEPHMRKPHGYYNAYKNYADFKTVFTFDNQLLSLLPNAKICYFGGSAIPPEKWTIAEKSKLVSIIVSIKQDLPGNIMRHQVIQQFGSSLDLFGYMNPIPGNFLGLNEYMFNICIENSKHDWYFTEKICDCFALGTIPIYWGTDAIGDFFNTDGILKFETFEDLHGILNSLSKELYLSKIDAIKDNFERAKTIGLYDKNILTSFGDLI